MSSRRALRTAIASLVAVNKLSYKKGVWTVVSLNDTSYVEAGAK